MVLFVIKTMPLEMGTTIVEILTDQLILTVVSKIEEDSAEELIEVLVVAVAEVVEDANPSIDREGRPFFPIFVKL